MQANLRHTLNDTVVTLHWRSPTDHMAAGLALAFSLNCERFKALHQWQIAIFRAVAGRGHEETDEHDINE